MKAIIITLVLFSWSYWVSAEEKTVAYKYMYLVDRDFSKAVRDYRQKNYREAFQRFSELSQFGLKEAQTMLGVMYLKGEYVEKSIERGLLWLGVAKEGGQEKKAAESFNYVYAQLSVEHKANIDKKLIEHIQKFGAEAQSVNCKRVSEAGSNITPIKCIKEQGSRTVMYPIP